MALDVLVLGDFVFTAFAVPERLPLGGRQQMHVHKLPGGERVIDTMGPDDKDRVFSGVFAIDGDALDAALTLDAMRIEGAPLTYSNGAEARIVVIADFSWEIERFNVIHFTITLTPADNPAGGGGFLPSLDNLASSDLGWADAVAASNTGIGSDAVASQSIASGTPAGTGGIGWN